MITKEQLLINKQTSGTDKEKKLINFLYDYREQMKTDADHGDAGNKIKTINILIDGR